MSISGAGRTARTASREGDPGWGRSIGCGLPITPSPPAPCAGSGRAHQTHRSSRLRLPKILCRYGFEHHTPCADIGSPANIFRPCPECPGNILHRPSPDAGAIPTHTPVACHCLLRRAFGGWMVVTVLIDHTLQLGQMGNSILQLPNSAQGSGGGDGGRGGRGGRARMFGWWASSCN